MAPAISTTPAVEVWVPIEGYDGQYDISTFGNVRSNWRILFNRRIEYDKPLLMKLQDFGNGYMYVKLRGKMIGIHRLVAKSFIPNPNNLPQVNHKDENKSNNNVTNLEWCTSLYNINYGTGIKRRADSYARRIEQLSKNLKHIAYYNSTADIVRATNGKYRQYNICRVANGHRQTAYGYIWRYVDN